MRLRGRAKRLPTVRRRGRRELAAQVGSLVPIGKRSLDCPANAGCRGWKPKVVEHHRRAEDGGDGVGDAFARDIRGRAMHRLEHRGEPPLGVGVRAGGQAQAAAQHSPQVGQQIAEQVRGHDDVEPLRPTDEIHD
jgi:hypothetical protein